MIRLAIRWILICAIIIMVPADSHPRDSQKPLVAPTVSAPLSNSRPGDSQKPLASPTVSAPLSNAISPAISYCLNGRKTTAAETAILVPADKRDQLQSLLDQYGTVRLQAADYRGALREMTLRSGQQVFGIPSTPTRPGTRLPRIVVPGGTANALLYGVEPEALEFRADGVTRNSCFFSIRGCGEGLMSLGAALDANMFVDITDCAIKVDNRRSGYLRNNRFIRVKEQSLWPQIEIRGDPQRISGGNVILWYNALTPHGGSAVYIDNQADMAIVAVDAEAWNEHDANRSSALLTTGAMGSLRLMSINGGDNTDHPTPVFDIAADELRSFVSGIDTPATPAITLRPSNQRAAIINDDSTLSPLKDGASNALRFRAFPQAKPTVTVNGNDITANQLSAAEQSALRTMFVTSASDRSGDPWERPSFVPIPDPVGHNRGDPNRDDSNYIQRLIDSDAVLPAGTYYVSKPLIVNTGRGLRGSGDATTAILAKSPDIDMVISTDHLGPAPGRPIQSGGAVTSLTLTDVTLQGGKNGIHHEPRTAGGLAAYSGMYLSHVTFRDMAEAGIFVDNILGWDNNFLDFLNFYHNRAAIKERAELFVDDPSATSEVPYEGYLDKNVFYHNQYVRNGVALDLQATRQGNANMWVNSLFQDNDAVLSQSGIEGTVFANSDFINNGGNPVLRTAQSVTCVSCYFRADDRGTAMIGTDSAGNAAAAAQCEGCIFEMGSSKSAHVSSGGRLLVYNSKSVDMPLGSVESGLFLNNTFASDPMVSQPGVFIRNRKAYTFITGTSHPLPQLLYGIAFPSR